MSYDNVYDALRRGIKLGTVQKDAGIGFVHRADGKYGIVASTDEDYFVSAENGHGEIVVVTWE